MTAKKPKDSPKVVQAKQTVRLAKAQLKKARKQYKAAKKAAKRSLKKQNNAKPKPKPKPKRKAKATYKAKPKLAVRAVKTAKVVKFSPDRASSKARKPVAAQNTVAVSKPAAPPIPVKARAKAKSKAAPRAVDAPKRARASEPVEEGMRSAAEVAKSVIERLQSPPPVLPPDPVIPEG